MISGAIGAESDLETLLEYDLVILPVGHADLGDYSSFESHADDYMLYVETGGGLWVGQPNPYHRPGDEATINWVPYLLHLRNSYNNSDCLIMIVDDTHGITTGHGDAAFSLPGDTVTEMGPEWDVLIQGSASGSPSVLFAEYGAGMRQYVECTRGGGPVATESLSLDGVKALFKESIAKGGHPPWCPHRSFLRTPGPGIAGHCENGRRTRRKHTINNNITTTYCSSHIRHGKCRGCPRHPEFFQHGGPPS